MISEDFSSFSAVFFDVRQEDLSEWQLMSSSTSVRWVLQGEVGTEGRSERGREAPVGSFLSATPIFNAAGSVAKANMTPIGILDCGLVI